MAKLFGFVSLVLAGFDMVASYSLARNIAFATVAYDPMRQVDSAYAVRFWEQVGAVFGSLFWLAAIIFLFHFYDQARTRRALYVRAAWVISIQLAVIALSYLLPLVLALS